MGDFPEQMKGYFCFTLSDFKHRRCGINKGRQATTNSLLRLLTNSSANKPLYVLSLRINKVSIQK